MVLHADNNMAIPEAAATLRDYIKRPSRQLKTNWEVDLAALLQDYFQYLFKELEKSDNVRNAANFAEAALVIQASSEIYCKKVDYLFDHIIQLLGRLHSDETDDPKDKQKSGRSRVDELEKSRLFEEVLRKVVVPDIKNGMAEKVKLLVDQFHLLVKLREKQLYGQVDDDDDMGDNIDVDEIGEVNENETSREELTSRELLKKPLFPPSFWIDAFQMIEAGLRKLLHLGPEDPIDHAAVDAECERHKEQRVTEAVPDTQHNEENAANTQHSDENASNTKCNGENPLTQHSEENGKVDEDVGYVTGNEDLSPLLSNNVAMPAGTCNEAGTSTTVDGDLGVLTPTENTTFVSPPPPPPEPPPVPPDQISMTTPEQAASAVTSLPSTLLKNGVPDESVGNCVIGLRKDELLLQSLSELPKEKPHRTKVRRKRKVHTALTAEERIAIESLKDRITVKPRISAEYLKDSFLEQHDIRAETNDIPPESAFSVIYVIGVKNKKKVMWELRKRIMFERNLELLRKKYSQDVETFRGFEDMEPSDGETDGFCGFPSPPPVPGSGAAMVVEEEEGDFHGFLNQKVPETQPSSVDPSPAQLENEQQKSNNPSTSEQESSVNPPARREKDDNAPVIELEVVQKWREFIAPKLARAWERGHFEIHEYESEILEAIPQNSTTRTLTFAELIADKPTEDIPRYFLATLQLANSCNIEIRNSDPDPLAMNCMEMTLLSARRNEAMGEYQPPSENQGIRNPFASIRLPFAPISPPFAEQQAHSSHQYLMQEDAEKPSRKRKCNQSRCKDAATSEEDDEPQESEEDEWWLESKKVAKKKKLNKR